MGFRRIILYFSGYSIRSNIVFYCIQVSFCLFVFFLLRHETGWVLVLWLGCIIFSVYFQDCITVFVFPHWTVMWSSMTLFIFTLLVVQRSSWIFKYIIFWNFVATVSSMSFLSCLILTCQGDKCLCGSVELWASCKSLSSRTNCCWDLLCLLAKVLHNLACGLLAFFSVWWGGKEYGSNVQSFLPTSCM